jgi:hypothetical protein
MNSRQIRIWKSAICSKILLAAIWEDYRNKQKGSVKIVSSPANREISYIMYTSLPPYLHASLLKYIFQQVKSFNTVFIRIFLPNNYVK